MLPGVRFACDAYVTLVPREPARGRGGVVADRDVRARPDVDGASPPGSSTTRGSAPRRSATSAARVPRARRDGEEGLAFVVAQRDVARAAGGVRRRAGAQDGDPVAPARLRRRPRRRGGAQRDRADDAAAPGARRRGCAAIARSGKQMLLYPERGLELNGQRRAHRRAVRGERTVARDRRRAGRARRRRAARARSRPRC